MNIYKKILSIFSSSLDFDWFLCFLAISQYSTQRESENEGCNFAACKSKNPINCVRVWKRVASNKFSAREREKALHPIGKVHAKRKMNASLCTFEFNGLSSTQGCEHNRHKNKCLIFVDICAIRILKSRRIKKKHILGDFFINDAESYDLTKVVLLAHRWASFAYRFGDERNHWHSGGVVEIK